MCITHFDVALHCQQETTTSFKDDKTLQVSKDKHKSTDKT